MLLALCLVVQGLLSGVLPFQSGMVMASESEPEPVEMAAEASPAAPPCHQAKATTIHQADPHGPDHDQDGSCCEAALSACSSLCHWACAFTYAPPLAAADPVAGRLPAVPVVVAVGSFPPWSPPIPTPPPILTASAPA
jgi:hypothetical protein